MMQCKKASGRLDLNSRTVSQTKSTKSYIQIEGSDKVFPTAWAT
jgi:hypothetical protein